MSAACLWPYDFTPPNGVRWLPEGGGVRFEGMGCVVSRNAFPTLRQMSPGGALTVEVAVRPATLTKSDVPHILTFHRRTGPSPLMIGAWDNSLVVRLGRKGTTDRKQFLEIGSGDAFTPGETAVITVTTGPEGTALYVDGRLRRSAADAKFEPGEAGLGQLLLGTSPTANGEWKGDILWLKIYSRALTEGEVLHAHEPSARGNAADQGVLNAVIVAYNFMQGPGSLIPDRAGRDFDLIVPRIFQPLTRVFLAPPAEDFAWRFSYFADVALNILGFMPLSILSTWVLTIRTPIRDGRKAAFVVLACFLFSLTVELAQAFLPTRSSSLTDLIANTMGAAFGVALFFMFRQRPMKLTN